MYQQPYKKTSQKSLKTFAFEKENTKGEHS